MPLFASCTCNFGIQRHPVKGRDMCTRFNGLATPLSAQAERDSRGERFRLHPVKAARIRETYLSFFAERGHEIVPSASLVPSVHDPSVLLTTAGMQPFKPYFLGREAPPAPRLADVQKCFRTTDIEEVGNTARHLTFFEMLGNWSFGDYFKAESIPWGWQLSTEGFGMDPERIWATVFGGDEELGLGPDEEAIEIWRSVGLPDERIVRLGRADNFWQAGPSGPCGPCSELYLDRGEGFGAAGERPGDDTDRFLEFWNHVFMTYDLADDGTLSELPMRNIDTGMGLDRMAAVLQDVPSVFETDLLAPLVALAEELSGRSYGEGGAVTRAMRIVADHARGAAFLIADGVVPSNEDRGYILRRIMRRAIQQGRTLGLEAPWLGRFAERTIETMAEAYPELEAERETIARWVGDEEESFGRTLERGTVLLERLVAAAGEAGTSWIDAADAFELHDTYGFPYDLTKELLAERGLSVDDSGFEELMEEQRQRARVGAATAHGSEDRHSKVIAFAAEAPPTRFVGYETLRATTGVAAVAADDGRALVKLEESPFYAEGGGQVADSGLLRWSGGDARVLDVYRVGEDQALEVEPLAGAVEAGVAVEAEVDREARHATMRNHTATHLLHAALRERLGDHVRQAGSAVRPDKLRFDFTHGQALGAEELREVEDRVNEWVKASRPVRWLEMERGEAEKLGAMALFGEKYGEWVRVVEVDGVSRELCGGTHVANTAEVGIFKLVSEGSSAANVRRIEALTGPAAIDWFREREAQLREAGELLGAPQDPLAGARRAAERLREAGEGEREARAEAIGEEAERLAGAGVDLAVKGGDGPLALVAERAGPSDPKQLLELANRVRSRLGDSSAVVLGGADAEAGKVGLVALFSKDAVGHGLSAAAIVREIAPIVGGGGGGRDEMAQAGGRNPAKLDEALAGARAAIERELA
jgi:alanyl-tRNA synthetase